MNRNEVPDQPEEVSIWETAPPMGHNNIPLTHPLKYEKLSCVSHGLQYRLWIFLLLSEITRYQTY